MLKKDRASKSYKEIGVCIKNWRGKIPVSIVFPNSYYVGMSNLALHLLYKTLNDIPEVVCERVFFEKDLSPLSMESKRPLKSFELVFFTLSFELDYVNVVKILNASNININSKERKENEPIIVAGGPLVMANPEPIHGFFDLFLLGDIEAIIEEFMETYINNKFKKRSDIIEELSTNAWVYNPRKLKVIYNEDGTISKFEPENFHVSIKRYNGDNLAKSLIITDNTEFSRMFLLEGTRGCPSRCPFCLIGNLYKFIYDKNLYTPYDVEDVGIIGGGLSFHPNLEEVIAAFRKKGISVHFPSLRIDKTPLSVIEMVKDSIKTLTFGIEAGSEHLRAFIGKPIKDLQILERINEVMALKSFHLKLYFMVGLPKETKKDVEAIVDITKKIKHVMLKQGIKKKAMGNITVHISPFVPKPATPFQRQPMEHMETLKEKISYLKKSIDKIDNAIFTHESIKFSFLQAVFARGDRKVSDIVLRLSKGESLLKVMRDSPINLNFYALRERDEGELLPWAFISIP